MKIELEKVLEETARLRAERDHISADRDHYKSIADTLQATLEETEDALRAAKGQIAVMKVDAQYQVA